MKNRQKQKRVAKSLFKASLNQAGFVDNQKVRQILKVTMAHKPAGLLSILKLYKTLIAQALQNEEVVVETAARIKDPKQLEKLLLEKTAARKIILKTNPKIVFGAKLTHGDWIYDATLDAKLAKLLNS